MNSEKPKQNHGQLAIALRSLFGGLLMGLANLVPGISGGTMLLAAGIYESFIEALSDVTRFKFRFRSLLVLGCVVLAAGLGILLFAGSLKDAVLDYRWVMYSLFIGLTLGGLPVVWRLVPEITGGLKLGAIVAFLGMAGLAWLQANRQAGAGDTNVVMLFVAGLAGASAMILPGLSGGYLLILLRQYVPILSAVDQFKECLKNREFVEAMEPAFQVLLPVGLGVVVGVVLVGNLLKWLLSQHRMPTLGVLIGLLVGSVLGMWPFQEGVPPQVGDFIGNVPVTADNIESIEKKKWPVKFFSPTAVQIISSIGLIVLGFAITMAVAAIGKDADDKKAKS